VAEPGKHESGDATFERLKERELALFKSENDVGFAEFDAIFLRDAVDELRIELERGERSQEFSWRRISGEGEGGEQEKKSDQN
jgi:hypothetical protein